jgi:hypothetical protein
MKKKILMIAVVISCLMGLIKAENNVQKQDLKIYTGKYNFTLNNTPESATVELKGDTLRIVASIGSADLKFIENESFGIPQYGGLVVFLKDETKQKVIGIRVSVPMGNIELEGVKETAETTEQQ